MAPRNNFKFAAWMVLCGLALFAAPALYAQAWGGLETFNTPNTLPPGWEKSPNGVGAASPLNVWNVDDNPNVLPPGNPATPISPAYSGQYSLNWNDGVDANPLTAPGTPVEAGVLTPIVDLTYAPNPVFSFRQNWHRYTADGLHHNMWVRVWNSTMTTMLQSYKMLGGVGYLQYQTNPITLNLNRAWGQVRVEFYYVCGGNYDWEQRAAGWFIDDVDFTGLTPPIMAIGNPALLPTQTAGVNFQITLTVQNGTAPYTWTFVPTTPVPPGLTITSASPDGILAGPVNASGQYIFKVRVTDSAASPASVEKEFSLPVNRPSSFVFPVMQLPFSENFSTDNGWVFTEGNPASYAMSTSNPPTPYSNTSTGVWQRGATVANTPANTNDGGDPPQDQTPSTDNMLLGVNIGGTIPTNVTLQTWYWAYSPEIDIGGHQELTVKFWRWMNVGNISYHQVSMEMWKPQTSSWISVWSIATGQQKSTQWSQETIQMNLQTAPAANATTRIRVGWRVTNAQAFAAASWLASGANIDDLEVISKPQTGLLNMHAFQVISPLNVGAYAITFVGNSYPVVLALENTTANDIAVFSISPTFLAHNGSVFASVNVGTMNFVPGPAPSTSTPLVVPPGIHYLSYDPAAPPGGAGPEIGHFDFNCTNLAPTGHTSSTYLDIEIYGTELGGAGRSTVTYTNHPTTGPTAHRAYIDVRTLPPLEITTTSPLPPGSVNVQYSFGLTAQHGTPPYQNWRIDTGPPWMTMVGNKLEFNPTPADVPNPPQSFNVTIKVDDSAMPTFATATKQFSVTINSAGSTLPPLQIVTPSQLPNATEVTPYSPVTFNAIGGTPPYIWDSQAPNEIVWLNPPSGKGPLSGMDFIGPDSFGGQPAAATAGTYAFTITCVDSTSPPKSTTATFYINVEPVNTAVAIITPNSPGTPGAPPTGLETAPYNSGVPFQFTATGGYLGPTGQEYLWTVIQGQLPDGLSLDPNTGELFGTPSAGGTFVFTLRASDGAFPPSVGTLPFEITVDPLIPTPLLITNSSNLPQGSEGNSYQQLLGAQNGKTPYSWRVKQGSSLPLGLGLDQQTGEIVGVIEIGQAASPVQDFVFTIEVIDGSIIPEIAEKTFTLNVVAFVPGPLLITNNPILTQAGAFSPYSTKIYATGGSPADPQNPYFFSVGVDSQIPNGLILESNGKLHGKPAVEGEFTFKIEAFDGSGGVTSKTFTLQINGSAGNEDDVTVVRGNRKVSLVPFWEACSVGAGASGTAMLVLAMLGAVAAVRRRKA